MKSIKVLKKGILILILLSQEVMAQKAVPYFGKISWINGFAREISGENIDYYSAFPDYATKALLTRNTDGKKAIEWETTTVPQNSKGDYVYFGWVAAHSSATSSGKRNYDLYVDGVKLLTFTTLPNNQMPNWRFDAPDGSALVFQQTKRDGANDAHGLAFLRLPLSKVKPGKPVRLKIVGQAEDSKDWFMTFKFSFEEKVTVAAMPFLLKNGKQPIVITALHFGKDEPLKVKVNDKELYTFVVKEGVNNFDIPVAAVKKDDSVSVYALVQGKVLINSFVHLKPVVYRELNFIHHSHTDIGYSHLQPEVLKIHIKNIDDALAMIDKTRSYPAEARFKWNIESLWAVEHYLQQASPVQKEKFLKAVKSGSICLSALYANILTGLSQPEEMFHYTDYAVRLRKELGLKINSAMISDVPGFAWTTVTALSKGGVKYFSSGPNFLGESHPYGGDRVGYFVKTWGDKPVWWSSPSGEEKVLFWAGAKGYSSWHGTAIGAVFERGPKKIAAYLNELTEKNYPYELVQWRYNIVADNGPIDTTISDFVKQWNEKYSSPKIVLNTTDKLFETFEQKYGAQIPSVKGDMTPYWEDGAISTASEEGKNRVNSLRLQQLTTLYAMVDPKKYDEKKFYNAWTNVIMFHEHTWGAHNSITEPDVPFVTEQWRIKKQFMLDADAEINTLWTTLMQPLRNEQSNKIAVFNTSSWKRSGPVEVPGTLKGKSVKDASGKKSPLQKLANGNYVFMANDVPALGSATYEIVDEATAPLTSKLMLTDHSMTNGKIGISWDSSNGSIASLAKDNDFNYAGTFNNQGMNSYWYVPGLNPAEALTNGQVRVAILENGPVLTTISLVSEAPGANALERRISLYNGDDKVLVENVLDKKKVRAKEGVHFGYPFNSLLTNTTLDAGYGSMHYLKDQLAGSNMDYLYGRRWLDASSSEKGLQWMWLETPFVEPGNIIDERQTVPPNHKEWKKEGHPTATWFSYAMNNYWHTNYKADQEGVAHFRYALRPHDQVNESEMEMSASEFTQPLIALPIKTGLSLSKGLFELTNTTIVVTSVTPNKDGTYLIRLFNPEQLVQATKFVWKSLQPASFVELKSEVLKSKDAEVKMAPMGVAEFLLKN
ncbi:glycoside hydrolase family 38 N-terminal domain-containing protein [Solitalea koreensis]|uniref:Glycosyl hydrolases family 38 N-terminal domain-containing protein n=1 Tax=Solitalea koreensis TaxID=543615 RepID=A0A521DJA5_9SPHI|nr:glycoside hydrolase [Solitalea koreensis]SMO71809.1 Glycosyl hydrolases family 38 N-terminal domain-containing protein [Solitalea koreensis]